MTTQKSIQSHFSCLPKHLWDSLQAAKLSILPQQSLHALQNLSGVHWSPCHTCHTTHIKQLLDTPTGHRHTTFSVFIDLGKQFLRGILWGLFAWQIVGGAPCYKTLSSLIFLKWTWTTKSQLEIHLITKHQLNFVSSFHQSPNTTNHTQHLNQKNRSHQILSCSITNKLPNTITSKATNKVVTQEQTTLTHWPVNLSGNFKSYLDWWSYLHGHIQHH